MSYSIGVDYGTGSGRAFLVDTTNGKIIDKYIKPYTLGTIEKKLNVLSYHIASHFKMEMIIWKF